MIYCDSDGVLARFLKVPYEVYSAKGYYAELPTIDTMVKALNLLDERGYEPQVLTKVLEDDHSEKDKQIFYDRELSFIPNERRIFVPYSGHKEDYVIVENNILIDDYTPNLFDWEKKGGIGVKFYNGINGTKGRWKGLSINIEQSPEEIARFLEDLVARIVSAA